jgi:hypothetical protein
MLCILYTSTVQPKQSQIKSVVLTEKLNKSMKIVPPSAIISPSPELNMQRAQRNTMREMYKTLK